MMMVTSTAASDFNSNLLSNNYQNRCFYAEGEVFMFKFGTSGESVNATSFGKLVKGSDDNYRYNSLLAIFAEKFMGCIKLGKSLYIFGAATSVTNFVVTVVEDYQTMTTPVRSYDFFRPYIPGVLPLFTNMNDTRLVPYQAPSGELFLMYIVKNSPGTDYQTHIWKFDDIVRKGASLSFSNIQYQLVNFEEEPLINSIDYTIKAFINNTLLISSDDEDSVLSMPWGGVTVEQPKTALVDSANYGFVDYNYGTVSLPSGVSFTSIEYQTNSLKPQVDKFLVLSNESVIWEN